MLSKKQLSDVCLLYQGSGMCRYLTQDDGDYNKWNCLKHRVIEKAKIDEKVQDFVIESHKKNVDPAKQNYPIGDNCSGYPLLKNLMQGYDV